MPVLVGIVIAMLAILVIGRIITSPEAPGRAAFGLAAVASIWGASQQRVDLRSGASTSRRIRNMWLRLR